MCLENCTSSTFLNLLVPLFRKMNFENESFKSDFKNISDLSDFLNVEELQTNLDQFFLVIMGVIIIFMQAGFGFLEAGSIRAKNTTNILIKNYADLCAGKIAIQKSTTAACQVVMLSVDRQIFSNRRECRQTFLKICSFI